MSEQKTIGNIGENAVCDYLVNNGYKILEHNYFIRGGEIDIIARNDEFLVFVEVKTRKDYKSAVESVTQKKIGFIKKTALKFLSENKFDLQPRFDVACVVLENEHIKAIEYIENAF